MICEWCHIPAKSLDAHHLTYETLGAERVTDLAMICKRCHLKIHRFIDRLHARGFAKDYTLSRLNPYFNRRLTNLLYFSLWDCTTYDREVTEQVLGLAGHGMAWRGEAWRGTARRGEAWRGTARQGKAGRGTARRGGA